MSDVSSKKLNGCIFAFNDAQVIIRDSVIERFSSIDDGACITAEGIKYLNLNNVTLNNGGTLKGEGIIVSRDVNTNDISNIKL